MSENPVQYACGQRNSEPGVERIEAADRKDDTDHEIADVVVVAEDRCRACEQQRPGDRPAERLDEQDRCDEHADKQTDGAPVTRHVRVDVFSGVGFAHRTAGNRDGEDDREHDQPGADEDREEPWPNGIHLGESGFECQRVIDEESTDGDEHRTDDVLRLVDGLVGRMLLRLVCRGHTSPSSVRVDETRLSWSERNCSNCAPVVNASVQPFFTSASFHCCVPCSSSSAFTIAFFALSEMPGGARTPRQFAKVRSIPASLRVGALTPSTRLSPDTASTRSWPASIWSINSPGLDVPTVIFLPRSAVSRSPPPSYVT